MKRGIGILCFALAVATSQVAAQTSESTDVMLVADQVYVAAGGMLTAEGNVEALQGDVRIRAKKIEYDGKSGIVRVTGPIHLEQGDVVRVIASYAELDSEFRNAVLRSARMVLDQQLQMAATEMTRVGARYNVLNKAIVSSCRVCDDGSPPLWQIRARRVIHDQEERQIYFDHAQFRVLDVPVFYFPQLRLPDPTLKRASGFLIPKITRDSQLGLGFKLPYFFTLGDHKDLTLTPYLAEHTSTLEFRYRQAFRKGRIELNGAISDDNIKLDQPRHYVFAEGQFDLPRDYKLTFNIKATSDRSYLYEYDYSDEDRLNSDITVRRSRRDENTRFALLHYESLRANEDNATLPSLVAVAETERRYFPTSIGGELRMSFLLHDHRRTSHVDIDGPDADTIVDGRDVTRANATLWWQRNWSLLAGVQGGITSQLALDAFNTREDQALNGTEAQITPSVAAHMRWPLTKVSTSGVSYVLEPMAQVSWSGGDTMNVANDESTRVEFDEGNLLALSRFPSGDRRERGFGAALGLNWARYDPDGWQANLSFGQVYQETVHPDFTPSSGLSQSPSDLLIAGQIKTQNGLSLTARGLFDGYDTIDKASAHAGWNNSKLEMEASYIWLRADPAENRSSRVAEWTIDGRYRLSRHWSTLADWRYDLASGQSAEAGIGLEYRNECVKIGLSASRRFITSGTVQPSTNLGFTVSLLGFSVRADDKSYSRTCNANAG
ncbi:LPS-assembly protein LptD [Shimia litoralis]|uniref:LPS-assembly protein LptD n=1 Tax=Shimia litoralis TaxID=420403 RepID=A0A4U7N528_9RHOB|nr:LPS assembly protein LptD [Shimia litoralis]TKZ20728.1 LPS-assembly protein LptD [Shimia litoralis]